MVIQQPQLCMIVQLLHNITPRFWFIMKEKKKEKKQKDATATLITTKQGIGMVLLLVSYYNVHQKHIIRLLLMEKMKNIILLMVIKLELDEVVLQKHKKQLILLIFKVIVNYDLKLLKDNSIVQSMHGHNKFLIWFF